MSQVLQYGFPNAERLLCDNPACEELATHIAQVYAGDTSREVFGCKTHFNQLLLGQNVKRRVTLDKPGQHNSSSTGTE